MGDKGTELHENAVRHIVRKLTDMGYSVSRLDNSCPFTIYAEYGSYSFVADIRYKERAWNVLSISSKFVEDYSSCETTAKDKMLIFHTTTKRNPDFVICTDDIQRLGYLVGSYYLLERHYTSSLALLRKLLEASME